MASNNGVFCKEQFLCPICLDVFIRPVSTPCGHNFCMVCITTYWNNTPVCRCPICKEEFETRPDLKVNTFISEFVAQFRLHDLPESRAGSSGEQTAGGGHTVRCDACGDAKRKAVKSCMECRRSYCDVHLEPHHKDGGLKSHTLVGPLENLKERICKDHTRLLILFCRNDSRLLCDVCAAASHASHDIIPVQQACEEKQALIGEAEAKAQQMIDDRQQKVQSLKESVSQSQRETEDVLADCVRDFTLLFYEVHQVQEELVKVMQEKQKAEERQADKLIASMEKEITQLRGSVANLQRLKSTTDQLLFLQDFQDPFNLPHTMDLSSLTLNRRVEIHHMRTSVSTSVSKLRALLGKMSRDVEEVSSGTSGLREATLRYVQQYEQDVLLDPDTAHPLLIVSIDRKQVRYSMGSGLWGAQILKPNMFTEHLAVLGHRGFSSQRFYFEVFVGDKTEWCLGVATASIQTSGSLTRSPNSGLWAIWFLVDKFETFSCPNVPVHFGKVEKVGVFVDYGGAQISFYDVQAATQIYTFTECSFTEELYPYFNPCDNEYGSNLEPMVIVPVDHTHGPEELDT